MTKPDVALMMASFICRGPQTALSRLLTMPLHEMQLQTGHLQQLLPCWQWRPRLQRLSRAVPRRPVRRLANR